MAKNTQNNRKNQLIAKLGKIRKIDWLPKQLLPTSPNWENSDISELSKVRFCEVSHLY
jgi:hypothetical protein